MLTRRHEICGFENVVAAHEDVEVDVGLSKDRHVRVLWHKARDGEKCVRE